MGKKKRKKGEEPFSLYPQNPLARPFKGGERRGKAGRGTYNFFNQRKEKRKETLCFIGICAGA